MYIFYYFYIYFITLIYFLGDISISFAILNSRLNKGLLLFEQRAPFKDVCANCFCPSLLRTAARADSHATSCIERARQVLKGTMIGQMTIAIALLAFNDLRRFGDPYFSFQKHVLFTIISTLFKSEQKINVGS